MIPIFLQDFLVEELKMLFEGYKLKNVKDTESPLNIYPQFLPARKNQKDTDHYPYVVVKLVEGADPDELGANTCKVIFICGVYDKAEDYQGYRDSITIMQKLYTHLMRNRVFGNKYMVEYPIEWALGEDDRFPYFHTGLETTWTVGKISMEDDDLT
jgi:hypothetical protein